MNRSTGTLDVGRLLGILFARKLVVLATTIAVTLVAFGYSQMRAAEFEATAKVQYTAPAADEDNPAAKPYPRVAAMVGQELDTLIRVAEGLPVTQEAAKRAGMQPGEFQEAVQVTRDGGASVVIFSARAESEGAASLMATSYANALKHYYDSRATKLLNEQVTRTKRKVKLADLQLKQRSDKTDAISYGLSEDLTSARDELEQIESDRASLLSSITLLGEPRTEQTGPGLLLTLATSLFVGFGLGAGIALLLASLDTKLRAGHDDLLPVPVMVKVPQAQEPPKTMPLGPGLAEPIVADAFAALGARLMLDRSSPERAHVILVTSALPSEGKSSVASNVAAALAQSGRRVVLVDADMRRPTQDVVFPVLQGRPGLSQIITGAVGVEQALTLVAPNLAAIASGPRQVNASSLLASLSCRELLDRLSTICDALVIDAPPVLPVNDALALAPAASQVLLCGRIKRSNVSDITEAHAKLASAAMTPQAFVMVGTEAPKGYGYGLDSASTPSMAPATPSMAPAPPPPPPLPPGAEREVA